MRMYLCIIYKSIHSLHALTAL